MQVMVVTVGRDLTLAGALPPAVMGASASYTLTAVGGVAPYSVRLTAVHAPAGWTWGPATADGEWTVEDPSGGVWLVSSAGGVVTISTASAEEPGDFSLTFEVDDTERDPRSVTRRITVISIPLEVSGGPLPPATVGTPYLQTLTITGGAPPYSVPLENLVDGLSASVLGNTLTVSGTPTGVGAGPAGGGLITSLFMNVSDSAAGLYVYTQSFTLYTPALVLSGDYPGGTEGTPYSEFLSAAGGVGPPYTYTVQSGTLPAGLTLDSATSELHGTPTTVLFYTFTIRATDANGNYDDRPQYVDIAAGSVLWTPANLITPAFAWWEFDDPANTVVSSTYAEVFDKTGNGHHLTPKGSPVKAAIGINGLLCALNDGTYNGGFWITNSKGFAKDQAAVSVAGVWEISPDDVSATDRKIIAFNTSNSAYLKVGLASCDGGTANTPNAGGRLTATGSGAFLSFTSPKPDPTVGVATYDWQGNELLLGMDGTTVTRNFHGGGNNSENADSANEGTFMCFPDGSQETEGYASGGLLTQYKLPIAERQRIEGYWAWRNGTVAKLDASHPYKSAPPYV